MWQRAAVLLLLIAAVARGETAAQHSARADFPRVTAAPGRAAAAAAAAPVPALKPAAAPALAPLQAFLGALRWYNRALERRYYLLSFAQGGALALLGDLIAQRCELGRDRGRSLAVDWRRCAHLTALGFLLDGLVAPAYYELLDAVDPRRSVRSVAWKTAVGAVAFGPLVNGAFLAGVMYLRDLSFDARAFARALAAVTVRDVQLWPALDVLSFSLLPRVWRPLAASAMCLLFNVYISEEAHAAHARMPWPALGRRLERLFLRALRAAPA